MTTVCKAPTIPLSRGEWRPMGVCTMRLHSLPLLVMALVMTGGLCQLEWAQSPTYGLGRTPTAEEIRAWDISISPMGKELPPGRGTAKEGAPLYVQKGCAGCHGATGSGSRAPNLIRRKGVPPNPAPGTLAGMEIGPPGIMALRSPFGAT